MNCDKKKLIGGCGGDANGTASNAQKRQLNLLIIRRLRSVESCVAVFATTRYQEMSTSRDDLLKESSRVACSTITDNDVGTMNERTTKEGTNARTCCCLVMRCACT